MTDYSKTKIYKIWSPNTNLIYIGSTVNTLKIRMSTHTHELNRCSSKRIIAKGGAQITMIIERPCSSEIEKCIIEQEYIDEFRGLYGELVVNERDSYLSEEDRKKQKKKIQRRQQRKTGC